MNNINTYQQWLNHCPEAILVVNSDGTIVYANQSVSDLLNYPPDQLIHHPIDKIIPAEIRNYHGSLVKLFFNSDGKRSMRNQVKILANQGEEIHADIKLNFISTSESDCAIIAIHDNNKLLEVEKKLHQAELAYHHIFEVTSVAICKVSLGGRFMEVNDHVCSLFGYRRTQLLELSFQDITHTDDLGHGVELLSEVLQGKRQSFQIEKRYICSSSKELWCHLSVTLIRDELGFPDYFIAIIHDISSKKAASSQLREFNEQLTRMTKTDQLTQTHNRQALLEELEQQRAVFMRYRRPASIIFIDLNNFKQINDNYGHACGDQALTLFADTIKQHIRSSDVLARYAGDEFVILLPETSLPEAKQAVHKLKANAITLKYDDRKIPITYSAGIACINEVEEMKVEDWIKLADERMYREKR